VETFALRDAFERNISQCGEAEIHVCKATLQVTERQVCMSEDNLCTAGSQSVKLKKEVYINGSASIVGKKEGEGPLGLLFDMVGEDDMFGCNTWEEAESSLRCTLIVFLPNLCQDRVCKEIFAPFRKRPP